MTKLSFKREAALTPVRIFFSALCLGSFCALAIADTPSASTVGTPVPVPQPYTTLPTNPSFQPIATLQTNPTFPAVTTFPPNPPYQPLATVLPTAAPMASPVVPSPTQLIAGGSSAVPPATPASSTEPAPPRRTVPVSVWADLQAQRDRIHLAQEDGSIDAATAAAFRRDLHALSLKYKIQNEADSDRLNARQRRRLRAALAAENSKIRQAVDGD